ncbi:helix-turn-helix transcriptional regulator [Promicromonospora sp. CA-289599]|uniref:helix-turn-helix transcriptional regulator n=1 Tax=Promicromonospora sp. CA-289599 TaxID=3240014 RepID=UPI003D89E600
MTETEFGAAVRRWRNRAAPDTAGLPPGSRRRTPGLRREEVAQLAGISADYLTRLEQGRAASPSVQVVETLARALRLTSAERAHLFRLAGYLPPGSGTVPAYLTPGVRRMLDRLADVPVAVYDAAWTLITANAPYDALMGDTSGWRDNERNGVWRNFTGLPSRALHTPEEQIVFEETLVADLHLVAGRYPDDPALLRLIEDLRVASPRFAELWQRGDVEPQRGTTKVIDHPQAGRLTLDCDVLSVAGADLHLMVYTAEPGTPDADRLALALGTRSLVS